MEHDLFRKPVSTFRNHALGFRRRCRECGPPRGEACEQSDKARMLAAPGAPKAEIAIAKRAGKRDLADMRQLRAWRESRRRTLQHTQRAFHLAGLVLYPLGFVFFRSTPTAFVNAEDRRIENSVAQRLQPQSGKTLIWFPRNYLAAARAMIEIFEDYARVIKVRAVFDDEHGDFSKRILRADAISRIHGVGWFELHVVHAEQRERDLHLAPKRR